MRITVIVPAYNAALTLGICLEALHKGTRPPDELLLADDGSTDSTTQIGQAYGATVIPIGTTPSGPAVARNTAVQHAIGDLLIFIDADVVVHADTIARFEAVFADDTIAAAFGSYDTAPPHPQLISRYKNLVHHYVHQKGKAEAETFWAGCGAIRRSVFLAVGGFDADFGTPSIEDIELGLRLRREGYRIRLSPEIQCTHYKRWTMHSWLYTDIFCRAIPWSRLILSRGILTRDLNLDLRSRLSAVLSWLIILALPGIFWSPFVGILSLAGITTWIILQTDLLHFFYRQGGIGFAISAGLLHGIYLLYASATFLYVRIEFLFRHPRKQKEAKVF